MVADTGGNTGSQSATLVIRALALREVTPGDIFRILWKEAKVAIMIGIMLGILTFGRVVLFGAGATAPTGYPLERIGLAIALAISLQVVSATLFGAILPMAAARLKLDPAVVASPALTTVVDITGLFIFFTTANVILGL
jgi:magnesium transporter